MSVKTIDEKVNEKFDPTSEVGRDLYRPKAHEQDEIDKLRNMHALPAVTDAARASNQPHSQHNRQQRSVRQRFQQLRTKSPIVAIILSMITLGAASSFIDIPMLAGAQLVSSLTTDLDDQARAYSKGFEKMLAMKLKTSTKGCTGGIKITCRWSTMTNEEIEKFKAAGFTVESEPVKGFTGERNKIKSMTHTDITNGQTTVLATAKDFQSALYNNPGVRLSIFRAQNPDFMSKTDASARGVYRFFKVSRSTKKVGATEAERTQNGNQLVSSGESDDGLKARNLQQETDEKGKPTGRMIDPDTGKVVDASQQAEINRTAAVAEEAAKVSPDKIAEAATTGALKGVLITGAADSACSVALTSGRLETMAQTVKAAQAARFFVVNLATPVSRAMAGDSDEQEMTDLGNNITGVNAAPEPDEVIDESKIDQPGTADNPPKIANPHKNKGAFDAAGPRASLYGDVTTLDTREGKFSLSGGLIGSLGKINQYINKAIPGSNGDPRAINKVCRYVQNPFVRTASGAIGILTAIGSFGLVTAASIAGSLLINMALPYIMSSMASIAAGDIFHSLAGMDFGNGSFVGASVLLGTMALRNGLKPLSSKEAVAYTAKNQQTKAEYAAIQHQLARNTPFDLSNQYSFAGSILQSAAPWLLRARTSGTSFAMSLTSLLPTAFGNLIPTTKAVDESRFQQCQSPTLKALNIDADIMCNVRYGLSEEELAMDPEENAIWMAETGNIDKDDENGAAKDNGQPWNYVKFLTQCPNRTTAWGSTESEEEGDGANCTSKENEELNRHFRVYRLHNNLGNALDAVVTTSEPGDGTSSGAQGPVSTSGWAYPTVQPDTMTSVYKDPKRGDDHRGVDLVPDGNALGKPIFAARDGKVVAAGPADGFGNWIVITHQVDGKTYSTVYGHMYDDGVSVKVGDTVKAGQEIGRIGSNGNSSGPHLHFELWDTDRMRPECTRNGQKTTDDCSTDPAPILDAAKSSGGNGSSGNGNSGAARNA